MGVDTPYWADTPLWPDTPWADITPKQTSPPGQTPLSRHPPGQTPPPQQMATAADGMHHTGMHSYYHPQLSWGKVMFLHVSVILFTGGSASVHAGIHPQTRHPPWTRPPAGPDIPDQIRHSPRTRHPPGAYPPGIRHLLPRSRHPPEQCIVGDTGNKRAVRILLECILVIFCR